MSTARLFIFGFVIALGRRPAYGAQRPNAHEILANIRLDRHSRAVAGSCPEYYLRPPKGAISGELSGANSVSCLTERNRKRRSPLTEKAGRDILGSESARALP